MPLGGFNGSDPSPTLAQFQQYVADGRVHWFIGGGVGMRSDGGSASAQAIAAWVEENFETRTVDGVTLYDLSAPSPADEPATGPRTRVLSARPGA